MTTKVKALDRLIDAIAGSDVPAAAQTVAGTIDALADTLAGDDVTFTAQDIAGRISQLAGMIEDGTISIGGGGDNWKPIGDGNTHFWVFSFGGGDVVSLKCGASGTPGNITIDWGDGSTDVLTSTSKTIYTHAYVEEGMKCISFISATTDDFAVFGGSSNSDTPFSNDMTYGKRVFYAECSRSSYWSSGRAFAGCSNLKKVHADINRGYESMFSLCYGLEEVQLTDYCEDILTSCFNSCSALKAITIPASVTAIGTSAFSGAAMIHKVTLLSTTPPTIQTNTFSNDQEITFYVPAASVDAYKAAANWSTYADKIQAIPA